MKVKIITFHWATNYGAVLQAYALQKFLSDAGHEVELIDYVPRRYKQTFLRCFGSLKPWCIGASLGKYFKERKIKSFRKSYLHLTGSYDTLEQLRNNPPEGDVFICGSDQIWNTSFMKYGEGKATTTYFLDFGGARPIRIAYAASFGCLTYPPEIEFIARPLLRDFQAISVREESGAAILKRMGFDKVSLMPDPALLLRGKDYERLLPSELSAKKDGKCFFYILHDKQHLIADVHLYFRDVLRENNASTGSIRFSAMGIEQWLSLIKSSKIVVTNSFHGIVFSILFKRRFIALLAEGSHGGMNDRVVSLLSRLGLSSRILMTCDPLLIRRLLDDDIDWPQVDANVDGMRQQAALFLAENMNCRGRC